MSTIIFPSSPFNGQIYPEQPVPGISQYRYDSQSDTWLLAEGPCCGITLVDTGLGLTGGPITSTGIISLANTTVTPGSYTNANITVDAQGRITVASNGTSGGVEQIVAGDGISISPLIGTGVVTISASGVGNSALLDNISGLFDGTTTTFNLTSNGSPYAPPNAVQMIVTVGNIMQEALLDYTISGTTITFTTAPVAGLDCILLVLGGGQAAPASNLLLDDIQSGFNGVLTTFSLAYLTDPYTPANAEQLVVNLGGIQQKPGTHYTVSGSTITFTTPPAAGLNCFIIALYGGGFGGSGGGGGPSTFLIDTDNNIWSCNTAITPAGGYGNFLVGKCSGANLTGVLNYNNTFIGSYAGFCAGTYTGGYVDDNIFIGKYTGCSLLNGWYNHFIGRGAGTCATGGNDNNVLGAFGGYYNTGTDNNFFGRNVGVFNTSGSDNSFIGSAAGHHNTTGNGNSFIGGLTGYCNTTGNGNVFIGPAAGFLNNTGNYNNFIGRLSGCLNTTGSCNVYLGNFIGTGFATCNQHVFISDGAGCNRLMFNNSGAIGLAGANFGTAGQILTSCGSALAPVWTSPAAGTVTSISTGTGLSGGPIVGTGTISLANTTVTAASYTNANITVDAQGRITAASNGSSGTVTSVATGTGLSGGPVTTTGTISLANTAVTPGSYTYSSLTVDAQGRLTSASSGTTPLLPSTFTAKGDIPVGTAASSYTSLPVGSNGQILTADSTATAGVTWASTGATVITRSTSSVTLTISNGATGTGTITLPRTAILLSISLDNAVWFRLYNSAAASAADSGRAQGVDPAAGSGVLAEIITTSSATTNFSPVPTAANMESPTTTSYPVRITNNGTSGNITTTITYLTLEN